jgi:hypothetical protein
MKIFSQIQDFKKLPKLFFPSLFKSIIGLISLGSLAVHADGNSPVPWIKDPLVVESMTSRNFTFPAPMFVQQIIFQLSSAGQVDFEIELDGQSQALIVGNLGSSKKVLLPIEKTIKKISFLNRSEQAVIVVKADMYEKFVTTETLSQTPYPSNSGRRTDPNSATCTVRSDRAFADAQLDFDALKSDLQFIDGFAGSLKTDFPDLQSKINSLRSGIGRVSSKTADRNMDSCQRGQAYKELYDSMAYFKNFFIGLLNSSNGSDMYKMSFQIIVRDFSTAMSRMDNDVYTY